MGEKLKNVPKTIGISEESWELFLEKTFIDGFLCFSFHTELMPLRLSIICTFIWWVY